MKQHEISVRRKLVYAGGFVIFAVLLVLAIRFPLAISGKPSDAAAIDGPPAGSVEKFALLSGQSGQRSVGST